MELGAIRISEGEKTSWHFGWWPGGAGQRGQTRRDTGVGQGLG